MLLGKVVSNVWSTRKEDSLTGIKFLVVEILETLIDLEENGKKDRRRERRVIVAADLVGAGIDEKVLISEGSAARRIPSLQDAPVDAAVVGIIDQER